MKRLNKVAGIAMLALIFCASNAFAQATGGWTLNINNSGFNPLPAGSDLPYSIRIDNNSNAGTPETTIKFTVPATTIYNGIVGLSSCAPDPSLSNEILSEALVITCDVPALAAGQTITAVVNLRPMQDGVINLIGQIAAPGPTASRQTTINKGADVALALSLDQSTVRAGSTVNFSATVSNNGPYPSEGAKVVIPLPTGLSRNVRLPANCQISSDDIVCAVSGPLAVGEAVTIDFSTQAEATDSSTIIIAGSVRSEIPRDPIDSNNTASANLAVEPGTDVSLIKARAPSGLLFVGDAVEFILKPDYIGVAPRSATITDVIPDNYRIVSVADGVQPGWTCDVSGQTVSCVYAGAVGSNYTSPILVKAEAIAASDDVAVINTAVIASADEDSDFIENNTATDGGAFIVRPVVDLVASKSGPPRGLVTVGNSYDFNLSSSNEGTIGFHGLLTITDFLPAGLKLTNIAAPTGWSCTPTSAEGPAAIVCTTSRYTEASPLNTGQKTDVIKITTEVTQDGPISNAMLVSFDGWEELDGNPADNRSSVGLTSADGPNWADVGVIKNVISASPVTAGEELTFSLEVFNEGPAVATNVVLQDRFAEIVAAANGGAPADIRPQIVARKANGIVCSTETSGAYSRDLQCIIDELPVCTAGVDCPVFEITIRPGGSGNKLNSADAYSTQVPDDDTSNNVSTAPYSVTSLTDVTVTKTSPSSVNGARAGQAVTYIIAAQVLNTGLSKADNVLVEDTLPDGLYFHGALPSSGACSVVPNIGVVTGAGNNKIICELGSINNGAQQTVSVNVTPTTALVGERITNNAAVSTTTPETNSDNNTTALTLPVLPPELNLIIQKTDDADNTGRFDPVLKKLDTLYTIVVTNDGPSDSYNLEVVDTLPSAGFFKPRLEGVPSDLTCALNIPNPAVSGGTIRCTFPFLAAKESRSFQVRMESNARGSYVNAAAISSDEIRGGYEGPAADNTVEEQTTVRVKSDVEVIKTASTDVVDLRQEFSWTITVNSLTGDGYEVAENVTMLDVLPQGMELTRVPQTSVGTCSGAVGQRRIACELGNIEAGDTVAITLYTKITDMTAEAASNTAEVKTDSFDQNLDNNSSTGRITTVKGSSISGTVYRDFNDDGAQQTTDSGINRVQVFVTGTAQYDGTAITRSVFTDSNGNYDFGDLPPGQYDVYYQSSNEPNSNDGNAYPGQPDPAGTAIPVANGVKRINGIAITSAFQSVENDFTVVPVARLGMSKTVSQPVFNTDGSYNLTYTLRVKNLSLEPFEGLEITDSLNGAAQNFGSWSSAASLGEGEYKIVSVAGSGFSAGTSTVNTAFNGASDTTLVSSAKLAPNTTGIVTVSVKVQPVTPWPGNVIEHVNQANSDGTGQYSGQNVSDLSHNAGSGENNPAQNTPTTVAVTPAPSIDLEKTATPQRASGEASVGDRIDYSFTITNTGNIPLVNIALSDALTGLQGLSDAVIPRLNPGQVDSATFTAYYVLTQADLDGSTITNTATTTGQWGINGGTPLNVSDTDTASVEQLSAPGLSLVKEIEASFIQNPRTSIGDKIRYKITVTNTGNTVLRNVQVTDALDGVTPYGTGASFTLGEMQPAEIKTVYAEYAVTLADIDNGSVLNSATAAGVYGSANTPVTTPPSSVEEPLFREPGLTLVKTLVSPVSSSPRIGEMLTWNVVVTNTGNVTLSNLVVTDPLPDATITPANVPTLLPDASAEFTIQAPLQESQINAGEVRNTATINFNDPSGPQTPKNSNEVVTPLSQVPSIALRKTADLRNISTPPAIGEVMVYAMTIRNTGNIALENIILSDELDGFVLDAGEAERLAAITLLPQNAANTVAAALTEVTVFGSYALTATEIDAGSLTNIANVTGIPTVGPKTPVTDKSGTEFDNDEPTISDLERDASIVLIKTITNAALSSPPKAGDVLTFGFEVINNGNVTLNTIRIEELVDDVVLTKTRDWSGPLAAGQSNTDVFVGNYTLKQDDIDRGYFSNTARVYGTSVGGQPDDVSDLSGTDIINDTPVTRDFDQQSSLSIVKSAETAFSTPVRPGDVITYSFVVTNTGNVALSNVVLDDPLVDINIPVSMIAKLLPGVDNAQTLTATYSVKQEDIRDGEVKNIANVTGSFEHPVTGVIIVVPPVPSNEVIVPLEQKASLALVKEAASAISEPGIAGEQITYTFTVVNTGNLALTDVNITDPLPNITPSEFDVGDMEPGATATFTATYAITETDIDNEQVVNQATVTGGYTDMEGTKQTSDLSGPDIETDAPVIVPIVPPLPELTLVKKGTWQDANGNGYPEVGEQVVFTFTITNSGNAILNNVQPVDGGPLFNGQPGGAQLSAFTPGPLTLESGETATFTASYVLTQEDIDSSAGIADSLVNKAIAEGTQRNTKPYESTESTAIIQLPAAEPNDVVISKFAGLSQVRRGDRVPYTIKVENNSSSNAGPVHVIDTMPSGFRFVENSALINGNKVIPTVNGRKLTFDNLALGPNSTVEIRLELLVLSSAGSGKHINVASITDIYGTKIADDASATVEIVMEAVFDCGDIIGTVFDDINRNGYQDEGELGLPGVRVATVKGWLVTTDEHGRFHVACAALPNQRIGSNFIMKLDTRTLPSGYRMTTENPRVVRLTAGKMTKLNFGASITRVVRLDLQQDAFVADTATLKKQWSTGISPLIKLLAKEPSVLRLSYIAKGSDSALYNRRVKALRDEIASQWNKHGGDYELEIETRVEVGQ